MGSSAAASQAIQAPAGAPQRRQTGHGPLLQSFSSPPATLPAGTEAASFGTPLCTGDSTRAAHCAQPTGRSGRHPAALQLADAFPGPIGCRTTNAGAATHSRASTPAPVTTPEPLAPCPSICSATASNSYSSSQPAAHLSTQPGPAQGRTVPDDVSPSHWHHLQAPPTTHSGSPTTTLDQMTHAQLGKHMHCRMVVPTGATAIFARKPWDIPLHTEYDGMEIHPFSKVALACCPRSSNRASAYYIYCDGSYLPGEPLSSAWALTLVAKTEEGFSNCGYIAGRVLSSTNLIVDAQKLDSTTAELTAIAWALLLATQLGALHPHATVTVYSDSACAIGVATQWQPYRPQHDLARAVALLYADVACQLGVRLEHSPGHIGHPWQELADSLAKHFTRVTPPDLPTVPRCYIIYHRDMEWQWLYKAQATAAAAYPVIALDGFRYVLRLQPVPTDMQVPTEGLSARCPPPQTPQQPAAQPPPTPSTAQSRPHAPGGGVDAIAASAKANCEALQGVTGRSVPTPPPSTSLGSRHPQQPSPQSTALYPFRVRRPAHLHVNDGSILAFHYPPDTIPPPPQRPSDPGLVLTPAPPEHWPTVSQALSQAQPPAEQPQLAPGTGAPSMQVRHYVLRPQQHGRSAQPSSAGPAPEPTPHTAPQPSQTTLPPVSDRPTEGVQVPAVHPMKDPDARGHMSTVQLKVATYNVLTLHLGKRGDEDHRVPPKLAQSTRLQLQQEGVHIAGLQETRCKQSRANADGFYNLHSGGENGTLGCSLLFNTVVPYATGRKGPLYLKRSHVRPLVAEPRIMIARLSAPFLSEVIVSYHAPHHGRPLAERRAFWKRLDVLFSKYRPTIVLSDSNAQLGHVTSESVGPFGYPQQEDANGVAMHELVCTHNLDVVNTLHDHPQAYTFARDDTCKRIDYVCLHKLWSPHVTECRVIHDFDTMSDYQDHYPVVVTVSAKKCYGPRAHISLYDKRKFRLPEAQQHFVDCLSGASPQAWDVDVNTHATHLETQLRQATHAAFAKDRFSPHKPYIRRATMSLVRLRRYAMAARRGMIRGHTQQLGLLSAGLSAHVGQYSIEGSTWQHAVSMLHIAAVEYKRHSMSAEEFNRVVHGFLNTTLPLLRKQLRADRTQHVYDIARRVKDQAELGDAHQEWRELNTLLKYGGPDRKYTGTNELDLRCGPDGAVLEDAAQVAEAALRAFAKIEDAQVLQLSDCRDQYNRLQLDDLQFIPDSLMVPTFEETLALVRKVKKGKAAGPDTIPADVLAMSPYKTAELLHPLLVKCSLHAQEPFAWKLVLAHELYKGSGTMRMIEHFRSIFLANTCAKVLHTFLRQRINEVVGAIYMDTQTGGRAGRDCPMASQLLRTYMAVQKSRARTSTVIFLDLRSAFYTAIRQLAVRVPSHDQDLQHVYDSMSLPDDLAPLVKAILQEPEVFADIPCHLRSMVAETHRSTCFTMRSTSSWAASRRGTRPGTSLADLVFNVIYTRPLKEITARLSAAGLLFSMRDLPTRRLSRFRDPVDELADATYVDDTAFMLDVDNEEISDAVQHAISIIHEQMLAHGWQVNYKPGKSALLVDPRGKGARQMHRHFYGRGASDVHVRKWGISLHAVRCYKHLGTQVASDGTLHQELQHRCTQMRQGIQALRSTAYRSADVDDCHAVRYTDAFGTSRLLFQSESWPPLSKAQLAKLNSTLVGAYRRALNMTFRGDNSVRWTDRQVLLRAERIPLQCTIRMRRLKYLGRMLNHGPTALLQMLDFMWTTAGSWTDHLPGDVAWYIKFSDRTISENTGANVVDCFLEYVYRDYTDYLAGLRLAWERTRRYERELLRAAQWRHDLDSIAVKAGWHTTKAVMKRLFMCYECGATFLSAAAARRHRLLEHDPIDQAQLYARSSQCMACNTTFHDRRRLLEHLRFSKPRCLRLLSTYMDPMPRVQAVSLRELDLQQEHAKRVRGLRNNAVEGPSIPGSFGHQPASARDLPAVPVVEILEEPEPPQLLPLEFVPRSYMLILHLYSGRRREGDLQAEFERQAGGRPLWVLSIDVIFDSQRCDLSAEQALRSWEALIASGAVACVIAGPPCETWSAARGRRLDHRREGPRRLRSRTELWGLPNVSPDEAARVSAGNILYQAAARIFQLCLALGVSMVLEHPAEPIWQPDAPSSWHLPEMVALRGRPNVSFVQIDQCAFGQEARKPTALLACHLPALSRSLARIPGAGRCTHPPGHHRPALGVDQHGHFRTSRLKEYPRQMCAWLSTAILRTWSHLVPLALGPASDFPVPSLQHFYVPLDPYVDTHIGPDFARPRS